ncbi:MAG: hypothetical protein KJ558_01150, partial [Gammaproteobacteria bacterium]|nr:hypothetical protein [Gammaproteobacteria bacterium]MBU1653443.1 hypothetical protein [Gammaproteobacteria bacterium]MBU1959748.1 hypothetical protein [Gammaproteobacteria bacterium]
CGSGMNRHFQWPKPLKMKKTKNRIFRFRLAKWPGWPFCKFLTIQLNSEIAPSPFAGGGLGRG